MNYQLNQDFLESRSGDKCTDVSGPNYLSLVIENAKPFPRAMFVNGGCHTMALALWIASGGKGGLSAVIELEGHVDDPFFEYGRYMHMVYVDESGVSWDVDGAGATARYARAHSGAVSLVGRRAEPEVVLERVWVPVSIENLRLFLDDWHAGSPLSMPVVSELLFGVPSRDSAVRAAMECALVSMSSERNYHQPPYNDSAYRRIIGSGLLSPEVADGVKAAMRERTLQLPD